MVRNEDDSRQDKGRRGHQERYGDAKSSRRADHGPAVGRGPNPEGESVGSKPPAVEGDEQPPEELIDAHESWETQRREAIGFAPEAEADEDDEDELPYILERTGQFGVGVAMLGLFLAVFGVGAAWLGIQPLGNVSMFFSLVLVTGAMVFAVIIQAYRADFSLPSVGT